MITIRRTWHLIIASIFMALFLAACGGTAGTSTSTSTKSVSKYPVAHMSDTVEDFWGTAVPDPYDWMIDPEDEDVIAWVDAQNVLTRAYLDDVPARAKYKARLTELWDYPRYGMPFRRGDYYYFSKNDGLQNQSVIYRVKTLGDDPELVMDPNKLSEDGTRALTTQAYSHDGTLWAYGVNQSGSDWGKLHVRDLETGLDLNEVFDNMRYTSVAWKHDNSGFFYSKFPEPGSVAKADLYNYQKVFWHQLGTNPADDPVVFELPEESKDVFIRPNITDDGKYLLLFMGRGTDDRNGIFYREVNSDDDFTVMFEWGEAQYGFAGNIGSKFYIETDLNAPRGRLMLVDIDNKRQRSWTEIIAQNSDVISSIDIINNQFVIQYRHNAHEILKIYDLEGKFIRDIELPTMGSVGGPSGRQNDTDFFYSFTSYLYPSTLFRFDFNTGESTVFRKSEVKFDPTGYMTEQVFFPSRDGTQISMFLTYKKGIKLNGNNPVLQYGYGGFNIPGQPGFSIARIPWFEAGGIYAHVNLRGGSEYGEEWHVAGMLGNKQNVFDDFIAASEWLIEKGYTRTPKLAIDGASNGGLLVAACLVQRPELYGATLPRVGVLDMLRYQRWGAGSFWTPEYGNADESKEDFDYLYAYSPLHNIKEGVVYPPTMIMTADTDDRVVPVHSKKFAATLQAKAAGKNPILVRIETKAGHGAGKPTSKRIDEAADKYAFLFKTLGVNY